MQEWVNLGHCRLLSPTGRGWWRARRQPGRAGPRTPPSTRRTRFCFWWSVTRDLELYLHRATGLDTAHFCSGFAPGEPVRNPWGGRPGLEQGELRTAPLCPQGSAAWAGGHGQGRQQKPVKCGSPQHPAAQADRPAQWCHCVDACPREARLSGLVSSPQHYLRGWDPLKVGLVGSSGCWGRLSRGQWAPGLFLFCFLDALRGAAWFCHAMLPCHRPKSNWAR